MRLSIFANTAGEVRVARPVQTRLDHISPFAATVDGFLNEKGSVRGPFLCDQAGFLTPAFES